MIVRIDGVQIKSPSDLKAGTFRLSKSGRLSSGLMVMDIIAQKRRIDLTWKAISGKHLNLIVDLIDTNTFYTIEFPDPKRGGEMATMVAYVGDVNQTLFRTDGKYVWTDVTLGFIER